MTDDNIKELIRTLKHEIDIGSMEPDTVSRLREFEDYIAQYLDGQERNTEEAEAINENLLEKAQRLEVIFADRHPTTEGIMRQIIQSLSAMGI